jgi:hypothetical protein
LLLGGGLLWFVPFFALLILFCSIIIELVSRLINGTSKASFRRGYKESTEQVWLSIPFYFGLYGCCYVFFQMQAGEYRNVAEYCIAQSSSYFTFSYFAYALCRYLGIGDRTKPNESA